MMIHRNFIIFGIVLICVTAATGAVLVNDTCHTVWMRENITKKAAKVECNETARVHDPKSQNGSYLMEDTGNWVGEIFACLCSCQLPFELQNGQILSKDRIRHGEALNYSCNEGYEKNIEKKIVCLDGLLMTVPGWLETQDIDIFTRQKSLPDWFENHFDDKIFDLWVNKSVNWSIPDTELQKNQKVFQILSRNETILQYYICRGKGCMLGCVSLSMGGQGLGIRGLECKRKISGTTATVPSSQDLPPYVIPLAVIVPIVVVVLIIFVIYKVIMRRKKGEGKETTSNNTGATQALTTEFQEGASQVQPERVDLLSDKK